MATLLEISNLSSGSTELKKRFLGALIKKSWDVLNEDAGTSNHGNRLALAKKVLVDPPAYIEKYWLFYMSNDTVQANMDASPDNDLLYVVSDLLDEVANAEAA